MSLLTRRPDWMRTALGIDPNYEVPRELSDLILPTVDITRVAIRGFTFTADVAAGTADLVVAIPGRNLVLAHMRALNLDGAAAQVARLAVNDGAADFFFAQVSVPAGAAANLNAFVGDLYAVLPPGFTLRAQGSAVAGIRFSGFGWSTEALVD